MNNGNNEEHTLISPSSAKKLLGCAAALLCEADIPNISGERAVVGTGTHTLSEFSLNKYLAKDPIKLEHYAGYYLDENGHGPMHTTGHHKNEVKITDEMVGFANKYISWAIPIIDSAEYVEIEMRVDLTQALHPGYLLNGKPLKTKGTADIVAVVPRTDGSFMLLVGDLKTGRHKVDAKENWQLMLYAIGVLRKLSRRYNITLIRLAIFQPLAGGASEYDMAPEALALFAKHAARRSVMALDVYAKGKKELKALDFTPSASACQWCRFAEKCSAKAKAAVNPLVQRSSESAKSSLWTAALKKIQDLVNQADHMDVWDHINPGDILSLIPNDISGYDAADKLAENHELTPEQLKAEWDKLPELRQHIATIEKAMMSALMSGVKVDGLKLVEGKLGNRAWSDAEKAKAELEKAGVERDLMYKETFISPTDAEKVFKGPVYESLLPLITRKPGAPSIAEADDKRPGYKVVSDEDLA